MSNMITSSVSALTAYQRAIDVAAQNIANANTEGYVRQRVELSTQFAAVDRFGVSTGGVKVDGVRREVNEFLIEQARTAAAGAGRAEAMAEQAGSISALLGSAAIGPDDALQRLKNAFTALSTEPASLRARDSLVTEIGAFVERLRTVDDRLRATDAEINGYLANEIDDVNLLLSQVSALNEKLFRSQTTTGLTPSPILDERDRLIDKLSFKLGIKVSTETNNSVTIKTMDGRFLVKGSAAATLTAANGIHDLADSRVALFSADGVSTDLTNALAGGTLGGLIDARTQVTTPVRNELGRVVIALAQTLNSQNALGRDLDGNVGSALLTVGTPKVFASAGNSAGNAVVKADLANPATALTSVDYLVTKTASGWEFKRTDTGALVTPTSGTGTAVDPFIIDGIKVWLDSGSVATADSFLVRPTHEAVTALAMATADPRKIAARVDTSSGVGDNRNVLELIKVFDKAVLDGAKSSVLEVTSRLANKVGAQARSAEITFDVQKLAVDEANRQRSDIYGVSLDEEAANLMRFQQAYQASASVIRAANELFDVLLGAVN
jgi:flagellar hook-associated protein 1 FlgK